MERTFWLSLMVLGLGIAVLLTARAAIDGATYLRGVSLAAEIQQLDGAPSSRDLADRTTEAAGCIYGNRSRVHTCWYAWAHPERPEYLAVIADRIQVDSGGSALGYFAGALPFWVLALVAAWRASRRRTPFRPSALQRPRVEPMGQPGRLMP